MVNVVIYQGNHVVGTAPAVAVDARSGGGGLGFVAAGQEHYQQHGSHSGGGQGKATHFSQAGGPSCSPFQGELSEGLRGFPTLRSPLPSCSPFQGELSEGLRGFPTLRSPPEGVFFVYGFYQMVYIHISFIFFSFSLARPMRVVTLVGLMPSIFPISAEEKPSR